MIAHLGPQVRLAQSVSSTSPTNRSAHIVCDLRHPKHRQKCESSTSHRRLCLRIAPGPIHAGSLPGGGCRGAHPPIPAPSSHLTPEPLRAVPYILDGPSICLVCEVVEGRSEGGQQRPHPPISAQVAAMAAPPPACSGLQTFALAVPAGVGPGQTFKATLNGQPTMVMVPSAGPSSTVYVQVPVAVGDVLNEGGPAPPTPSLRRVASLPSPNFLLSPRERPPTLKPSVSSISSIRSGQERPPILKPSASSMSSFQPSGQVHSAELGGPTV